MWMLLKPCQYACILQLVGANKIINIQCVKNEELVYRKGTNLFAILRLPHLRIFYTKNLFSFIFVPDPLCRCSLRL